MKNFTLIELLVVVAIIGILASILMPSLQTARYKAKNAVCISNVDQLITGTMVYAADSDNLYPAGNGHRRYAPGIRGGGGGDGNHNLRDVIDSYYGDDLNASMRCPLAHNWWRDNNAAPLEGYRRDFYSNDGWLRTNYSLYYNPVAQPVNTRHWGNTASVKYVGDTLIPKTAMADDGEYNVIISDVVMKVGYDGSPGVLGTHEPMSGGGTFTGNHIESTMGYWVGPGKSTTANYGRDDGSVFHYSKINIEGINAGSMINMHTHGNGGNGWVIPANTRVDQ